MEKKISTEKKINNEWFKLKIGTTDKKEPNVVYIEGGISIMPTKNKTDYKPSIKNISNGFEAEISKLCSDNSNILSSNHILNFEIAENRIKYNKSTFLSFQIFLRQKCKLSYKEIVDILTPLIESSSKNFINCIMSNDFSYSKRKN